MIAYVDTACTGGAQGARMEDAGMIGGPFTIHGKAKSESPGVTGINQENRNTGVEEAHCTRLLSAKSLFNTTDRK